MRIENLIMDEALIREAEYGRLKTYHIYNNELNVWGKEHVCTTCSSTRQTKIGILVHLARTRNNLEEHYDLLCPYCPGLFRTLQSLNRHLRKPPCEHIKLEREKTITI